MDYMVSYDIMLPNLGPYLLILPQNKQSVTLFEAKAIFPVNITKGRRPGHVGL